MADLRRGLNPSRAWLVGVLALVVALPLGVWGVHLLDGPPGRDTTAAQRVDPRPSIVMVLMDDASYELLATMPQAQRMRAQGATYLNAHVVDSLCCPSRAAIFTGRPPHQTGVLTNTANDPRHPTGGYAAYVAHDDSPRAFNVALRHQRGLPGPRQAVGPHADEAPEDVGQLCPGRLPDGVRLTSPGMGSPRRFRCSQRELTTVASRTTRI